MSSNIAIIFGAGAKVGSSVARKFLANNYKVVTVSRSDLKLDSSSKTHFHFKGDLTDLTVVPSVFSKTREIFGEPRVIVYNAAAVSRFLKDPEDFLAITPQEVLNDQNVNLTSTFISIQEAIKSFDKIPSSDKPKAFIYTGNIQNIVPFPFIVTAGLGKAGAYSALGVADKLFGTKGYRFYFADERTPEGGPVLQGTSGEGAAEFYFDLAENENNDIPVETTFVTGKGYTVFDQAAKF